MPPLYRKWVLNFFQLVGSFEMCRARSEFSHKMDAGEKLPIYKMAPLWRINGDKVLIYENVIYHFF